MTPKPAEVETSDEKRRGLTMAGEERGAASRGSGTRATENDLLLQAATTLRLRYESGNAFSGLSPAAAAELENVLNSVAMADDDLENADREEAIALAHRLLDDDHPELSPLWPSSGE